MNTDIINVVTYDQENINPNLRYNKPQYTEGYAKDIRINVNIEKSPIMNKLAQNVESYNNPYIGANASDYKNLENENIKFYDVTENQPEENIIFNNYNQVSNYPTIRKPITQRDSERYLKNIQNFNNLEVKPKKKSTRKTRFSQRKLNYLQNDNKPKIYFKKYISKIKF